ncbi:MAG TPA: InlB B-repeat-containing protein, partial [Acholeplasma sp.]|nr:InlB B-repeat-containing protein [Acholeplasma sp.]
MRKLQSILLILIFSLILVACGDRKVTITFETNGGTAVPAKEVSQLKAFEEPVTTRTGHTFKGWFREDSFETLFDFEEGASRNMKLYAKWEINSYTVTLKLNNGEDDVLITDVYNSIFTLPTPTRTGYRFIGWYQNDNLTEEFTQNRIPGENKTLYARWSVNSYKVTFIDEDGNETVRNVEHGKALTNIPLLPEKEGYVASWSITDFSNITSDLVVEAVYTIKTYEVVFKDVEGIVYETITVDHNSSLSPLDPQPTKSGYTFVGYSEDLTTFKVTENTEITVLFSPITYTVTFRGHDGIELATRTVIENGAAIAPTPPEVEGYEFTGWDKDFSNVTSNLEVNALYTKKTYSLVLDANGGLFQNNEEEKVYTYEVFAQMLNPETPTRLGYTFKEWRTVNNTVYTFGPSNTMPVNGLVLKAEWQTINYAITYSGLNTATHSNPNIYTIETPTITLSNPTSRVGYTFVGWFDSEMGGNQVTTIPVGSTGSKTIYARWKTNVYTITYENVENGVHDNPTTYTIATPVTLEPAVREGYTFVGWFDQPVVGNTPVTTVAGPGNKTLYARYLPIQYTITYENTEGVLNSNRTTYTIEDTFDLVSLQNRTHHTFVGWFDSLEDGNQVTSITAGTTGDLTLYARWQIRQYTIKFVIDGEEVKELSVDAFTDLTADDVPLIPEKNHYDQVAPSWDEDPVGHSVTGNYTFTAVYVANIYTITFETNDGSSIEQVSGAYNTQVPYIVEPTKEGYSFGGWYSDELLQVPYVFSVFNENITLYAKWDAISYNIIYSNIENDEHSNPTTYTVENTPYVLLDATREGYDFVGWFTGLNSGTQVTEISGTGNRTLYARW